MKHFCIGLLWLASGALYAGPAAPRWGGELRFCVRADPKTFDPLLVDDQPGETIRYLTGGVLIRLNRATQELQPELAESWQVGERGRSIEFRIRQGAQFSDGSAFTAADAAYTLKTILAPGANLPAADAFSAGGAITVEQLTPDRVRLRFAKAMAGVERLFDQVVMVSSGWPASRRAETAMPVLGPYRVAEYRTGSYVLLRRNPHYWRTAEGGRRLPYIDAVRVVIQQNRSLELLRFMKGDIDLVDTLDPGDYEKLTRGGAWHAYDLGPGLATEQMWFNQRSAAPIPDYKKAWFQSRDFRAGISSAVNRADLARVVYRGRAVAAAGPVSPANRFWFDGRLPAPQYAPEQALSLLARAGFRRAGAALRDSGGHAVEFSIITNAGNRLREGAAAMIQEDLAKIGVRVTVVTLDFPSLVERITHSFDYDACLLGFSSVDLDPNGQMNVWLSTANAHAWNPEQKAPATAWEAEVDRLMAQEATEPSAARRKAAFDQVQEIAAREAPMLFLVYRHTLCAASDALRNLSASVLGPQLVWNVEQLYFAPERALEARR